MILICLSAERGHYRVDDDQGHTLIAPFYSVQRPAVFAQRLANERGQVVRLRMCGNDSDRLTAFTPIPGRIHS